MSSTGERITKKEIREVYEMLPKDQLINIAIQKTQEIWNLREEIERLKK